MHIEKSHYGGFRGEAGVFSALHRWLQTFVNEATVNGERKKKEEKKLLQTGCDSTELRVENSAEQRRSDLRQALRSY